MDVDPVGGDAVSVGELDGAGLADENGTLVKQALDSRACRVPFGVEVVVSSVAAACLEAFDVEDVFDGEA